MQQVKEVLYAIAYVACIVGLCLYVSSAFAGTISGLFCSDKVELEGIAVRLSHDENWHEVIQTSQCIVVQDVEMFLVERGQIYESAIGRFQVVGYNRDPKGKAELWGLELLKQPEGSI